MVFAMAIVSLGAIVGAIGCWLCVMGWAHDIHAAWGIAVLAFPPLLPVLFRRHGNSEHAKEAKEAFGLLILAVVFLLLEFAFVEAIETMFGFEWTGIWWLQP